jgi:hypothetical protein
MKIIIPRVLSFRRKESLSPSRRCSVEAANKAAVRTLKANVRMLGVKPTPKKEANERGRGSSIGLWASALTADWEVLNRVLEQSPPLHVEIKAEALNTPICNSRFCYGYRSTPQVSVQRA